jgi:hypothetical protein
MQVIGTAKEQKDKETDLQNDIKKPRSRFYIELNTFEILLVLQQ